MGNPSAHGPTVSAPLRDETELSCRQLFAKMFSDRTALLEYYGSLPEFLVVSWYQMPITVVALGLPAINLLTRDCANNGRIAHGFRL